MGPSGRADFQNRFDPRRHRNSSARIVRFPVLNLNRREIVHQLGWAKSETLFRAQGAIDENCICVTEQRGVGVLLHYRRAHGRKEDCFFGRSQHPLAPTFPRKHLHGA
jgi:hypothetical protein